MTFTNMLHSYKAPNVSHSSKFWGGHLAAGYLFSMLEVESFLYHSKKYQTFNGLNKISHSDKPL